MIIVLVAAGISGGLAAVLAGALAGQVGWISLLLYATGGTATMMVAAIGQGLARAPLR